jgi:S1-C subfamily serine protease
MLVLAGSLAAASLHAAMPETIERVKPSIVAIGSYSKTRSPPFSFRGTGFVVGDGTLIATNGHVLPESAGTDGRETLVVVAYGAGRQPQPLEAKLVAADRAHDLVLLRIGSAPLPPLELEPGDLVREGQVFAFTGFPIGNILGFHPVTHRGMVASVTPISLPTANARQLDEKAVRSLRSGTFPVYQLDATAYPGNSGSPLYDPESGRVVGIVNMVFVKGTRASAINHPSGITFAIPARFLRDLLVSVR